MPRANRYILDGAVYHITQRCHNRQYLLAESQDRDRFLDWLRKGATRFGVSVLAFCVTCNHIHLLLQSPPYGAKDRVSGLLHLVAGTVAGQFNQHGHRMGAFWNERYACTMVDTGKYLWNCIRYIDLNMVRCGVVSHPADWPWTAYTEIMGTSNSGDPIDASCLANLLGYTDLESLRRDYSQSVSAAIAAGNLRRVPEWTESIAVGGRVFVDGITRQISWRRRLASGSFSLDSDGQTEPIGAWAVAESPETYGK